MKTVGGLHLIMDGQFEDHVTIDIGSVLDTFDELVSVLNMTYLTKPVVAVVSLDHTKLETEEDEGGVSIYAQITTSHIALHVWPMRNTFCLDIFSCKDFDLNAAGELLWERLDIQMAHVWPIRRDGTQTKPALAESVFMKHRWKQLFI